MRSFWSKGKNFGRLQDDYSIRVYSKLESGPIFTDSVRVPRTLYEYSRKATAFLELHSLCVYGRGR
jgi:hypothetical protein